MLVSRRSMLAVVAAALMMPASVLAKVTEPEMKPELPVCSTKLIYNGCELKNCRTVSIRETRAYSDDGNKFLGWHVRVEATFDRLPKINGSWQSCFDGHLLVALTAPNKALSVMFGSSIHAIAHAEKVTRSIFYYRLDQPETIVTYEFLSPVRWVPV